MAKKIIIPTETTPTDVIKRLVAKIKSMSDWTELMTEITKDEDMAKFCGCKTTSNNLYLEDGAKDQWRAIRKERPWEK